MAKAKAAARAGGKRAPVSRRAPPLTLSDPNPLAPRFAPLEQEHRLYAVAAWAYHHADDLSPRVRAGLFVALARGWPVKGRRKSVHNRGWNIVLLEAAHVETAEIAKILGITEAEVESRSREYWEAWRNPPEQDAAGQGAEGDQRQDRRSRIHAEPADGSEEEPFDPATPHGVILSQETQGDEDARRVEE